ncbi:MAG: hypothetical protein JW760_08105, partial [Spirochaetales bacterium]|nr:hypothetical protein [Spirochaetales bacterium]
PLIQLALLLDTSNSMDGLINQAKSQLWKIVAETGRLHRESRKPVLQVALYEYGNDNLSAMSGYIRQVSSFTTDLDYISSCLFGLLTYGGSEYCGQVIRRSVRDLDWDRNPDTLKLIFIAGNEPFTQGDVNYVRAVNESVDRDILVNTIFCGDYREGVQTKWKHGADIAGGRYMSINSDYEEVYIQAPQDERIGELNSLLNATYLGYGLQGDSKKEMQEEQDVNAAHMSQGSLLERARVKASPSYANSSWDLVDAYASGEVTPSAVPEEALPEEMRTMTDREKDEYVSDLLARREEIQAEILRLSREREDYLEQQTRQNTNVSTLDSALLDAILHAAAVKGFNLE